MAFQSNQTPLKNTITDKCKMHFEFVGKEKVKERDVDFYICKICSTKLNGTTAFNLVRHVKKVHSNLYNEIVGQKSTPIQLERLQLLQNIVEIIALNGRPFTIIHDSGFQAIIQKDLEKLQAAGCGLSLSHPNFPEVKKHLRDMATGVRIKIKEEVSGRPLSLLVDIVTKNNRSIFGMSVQFMMNGELKVRSIGMIELMQSHNAEYLSKIVCDRLHVFEIHLKQVFTITTDNGSNVLKMVKDVEAILKKKVEAVEHVPFECLPAIDDQISNFLAGEDDMTDEQAISSIFDEAMSTKHQNLLTAVCEKLKDNGENVSWDIHGIKCAAHIAQLAIKNSIENLDEKHCNVINLCRRVAKTLRLKRVRNQMNAMGIQYKTPRIEVDTRWGTLYLMVRKKFINLDSIFNILYVQHILF